MSALKIQHTLHEIERSMSAFAPYRAPALFNEFLVKGYTAVTLSSVPKEKFSELLRAKLCLGTLITLYDDFADRPTQADPQLLEALYHLRFGKQEKTIAQPLRYRQVLEFARSLFSEIEMVLKRLPQYSRFHEILNFDLAQFYSANQFSSLLIAHPHLNNTLENRLYAHHNMGMVMAAMMDLMAAENLRLSELGETREIFLMGQRLGRIFNVLTTYKREILDGDITGELSTCGNEHDLERAKRRLGQEVRGLYKKIEGFSLRVTAFSVPAYLEGLIEVQKLHEKMEGTI